MTSGIDYEFRTTVVPGLHNEKDIEEIGKHIKGAKKWGIQNFMIPHEKGKLIDSSYENVKPFPKEKVEKFGEIARKYVKNVVLRNI